MPRRSTNPDKLFAPVNEPVTPDEVAELAVPVPNHDTVAGGKIGGVKSAQARGATVYQPLFARQAERLARMGATMRDLADFFGVSLNAVNRWCSEHPEFGRAVKIGGKAADDRIERSLYQRAAGYDYEAVRIFLPKGSTDPVYAPYREHVPADVAAALQWLKKRRPEKWADHAITGDDPIAEFFRSLNGRILRPGAQPGVIEAEPIKVIEHVQAGNPD